MSEVVLLETSFSESVKKKTMTSPLRSLMTYSLVLLPFILLQIPEPCMAIKCFECTDIPTPSACGKVAECAGNSSCLIRQYVTTSGTTLFTSGCIPKQRCADVNIRQIKDQEADIDTCLECCDRDYCNMEGCGTKVTDASQRGPYCFECSAESVKDGCRNVRQCFSGYSCSLKQSKFPGYITASCMQDSVCPSSTERITGVVGRSSQTNILTLPFCCKTDFCNDVVRQIEQKAIEGDWTSWSTWSSCSNTCGLPGQQTRSRSCGSPFPDIARPYCHGDNMETRNCSTAICAERCLSHDDYVFESEGHLCYKYHDQSDIWTHGRDTCARENATLAIIDTQLRWDLWKKVLSKLKHDTLIFIGARESLHARHQFKWVNGDHVVFTDWDNENPNGGGDRECIAVHGNSPYSWNDKHCNNKFPFLCSIV